MALKALMLRKKIDDKQKLLDSLRAKTEDFAKRETELEAAITEAETDEEKATVETAITEFENEKSENVAQIENVEKEIADLNAELSETEKKQEESRKAPEPETTRKEVIPMNTRTKFFGMTVQERDAFIGRDDVKDFLARTRELGKQKRTVTGADLTIPDVMLELVRENVENYSKLISKVSLRRIAGKARQNIMGAIPEAVWTEMCAKLNELDFKFYQTEVDGYKVGGYIAICNATLEDSDLNLASEILTAIGQAIGYALDKAIVYGTGSKMPLGIVTRLAQTVQPDSYNAVTERPWVNLATSNIKTVATSKTAAALYQEIIKASGAAKNSYSRGGKVWIMNETTHSELTAQALVINASGAIVSGQGNTMPVVGGDIVILNFIPDNVIVMGYGENYLLVERAGMTLDSTDQPRWLEEQTLFKGTARYDGKPVIPESFVAIGINGVTPNATMTFAPDEANAEETAEE